MAGFIEKVLRFKSRKWRRQFVFFQPCHRHLRVSWATVVVMLETTTINIIFAFSQRWGFHYFIWPTARVIVALLRRLHRRKFLPLWLVTLAICSELTIFAFFSFLTVVFLAQWFVNFFLAFLRTSTSYGYFQCRSLCELRYFRPLV